MYVSQLAATKLPTTQIYLDPNNPRFWTEKRTRAVPDARITEPTVQSEAANSIDKHDVDELRNSILRNGFLVLDRIVVRPLKGVPSAFVVVEGNRRFRALTRLRSEIESGLVADDEVTEESLRRLLDATNEIDVLVYTGPEDVDIAWLLQGIRHISGIKAWEPAQRARLLTEQIDKEKHNFRAAGQMFALSPQAVARLYRTYKALMQMRSDEEYGSKARNDYFTLFEEAYRNLTVRKWMDWNESLNRYQNDDNVRRFYAWISPDDEDKDKRRRIANPDNIKDLANLISRNRQDLLEEVDRHEIDLKSAVAKARADDDAPVDWLKTFERIRTLFGKLPQAALFEDTDVYLSELQRLQSTVEARIHAAKQQQATEKGATT